MGRRRSKSLRPFIYTLRFSLYDFHFDLYADEGVKGALQHLLANQKQELHHMQTFGHADIDGLLPKFGILFTILIG